MECPFCDKKIFGHVVYEASNMIVIHNIRPASKGHIMVAPKRHVNNIRELTDSEASSLFKLVKKSSEVLYKNLKPAAINYGFNEGSYAGQRVEHFHFHIMPRFFDDNLPKFHLFHREAGDKLNLSEEELMPKVLEIKEMFYNFDDT